MSLIDVNKPVSVPAETEPNSAAENKEKSASRTSESSENIHNNNTNGVKSSETIHKMEEYISNRTTNELDNNGGVGVCNYNNKINNLDKLTDNNNDENLVEINNFKIITKEDFSKLSYDELWEKFQLIIKRMEKLDNKVNTSDDDESLKNQLSELQRKEAYQVMRLTAKEQELQEMITGSTASKCLPINRGSFLDPAVNLCIERLKKDLEAARTKMEEAQNELAAWKFTPDSNTGKQLMAKCRSLIKENEELGRVISSGKLSKLEGDIALQRNFTEELKKSQSELDEFLLEMDEDTEGMQGTIVYLQDQLRVTKQQLHQLQESNSSLVNSPAVNITPEGDKLNEEADIEDALVEESIPSPTARENKLSCANVNNNNSNSVNILKSDEIRTTNEKSILESLESQIIPHEEFERSDSNSGGDLVTNGKRTIGDAGNDIKTEPMEQGDDIEPPCKKSKAIVLGDENNVTTSESEVVENGN